MPWTCDHSPMQEIKVIDSLPGTGVVRAVANALRPFTESAGLPTNLNNAIPVQKEEEHYMHGII